MNYEEALDYLASLNKFGINLGLARIEKLLNLMKHPERRFKTVHVTGTNGKGSTTATIASILTASGIKTGMYTSPHLIDYTERMVINGRQATQSEFAGAIAYTAQFVDQMVSEGYDHPTEFEVLTAAAFYYFAANGVDYAVIEVGLGGLLDSTNVIVPQVSIITNVSLEHTDRCGPTVGDIAKHKAGIIKESVPVVTAADNEALAIITETASRQRSELYVWGRDFVTNSNGQTGYRQLLSITTTSHGNLVDLLSPLLGVHQVKNVAVAVMAALVLADSGAPITNDTIRAGLASVYWPGRFQVVEGKPTIVIDGAHNPDGAKVLRQTLDEVFPSQAINFLLGILRDKDIAGITSVLVRPIDNVVAVSPQSYRAAEPEEIAREIKARYVTTAADIETGLKTVKELAGKEGIVCVAGSLYLIGAVYQFLPE